MTRLYLAGPMTGLPDLNFPAFRAESLRLRSLGFDVVNPAEINMGTTMGWVGCMKKDIPALLTCTSVALLDGWENSQGATLEVHIARKLGMAVLRSALITQKAKP